MPKQKIINLILFCAFFFGIMMSSGCGSVAEDPKEAVTTPVQTESDYFINNNDGTVTFTYQNTGTKKVKAVVQKEDGKMYQYDVPTGDVTLTLPLTEGNGTYKLYICKNVKDNKYSVVESTSITLSLSDENDAFLKPHVIINWNTTNEAIKEAQKLTENLDSDESRIKAIYEYVVTNYSYDYDKASTVNNDNKTAYVPDIDDTYATKTGICYDLSSLFAAMLRSVNIPAKVVTGYTVKNVSYHAWNKIYYKPDKNWRTVDVTYDIQMYADGYRYNMFKKDEDYEDIVYIY